ncbi:MAG: hypothetical protein ACO1OO_03415 [Flavisolibacter sp.]
MKLLSIILFLSAFHNKPATVPDIAVVRRLYVQAPAEEEKCQALLQMVNGYSPANNPTLAGYKAAATMIMAKHTFNPFSKLSHFNKGKNMLQQSIAADNDNLELRFLRYSIQKSAPSFLGYRGELAADENFLKTNLPSLQDAVLRQMILDALKLR